ncbi:MULTISPECIES: glycine zipper 2TM domain-containing protein [unclassified Gilliamella]|uniref:glycine zipper 2TM domain-containing protein n=1 Tax=unclassified Gilliamella TaxID=2685620 RepID=UPI00226A846F|nr:MULTISPECIES: glycine zipper 2TM domain-containing protein [unclassified Gilliamella]MCX8573394.1 glycine zipper 2TM domain-containing protein [Gilliamella sp. B3831]MCX8575978.1 glycine zipper 2TM domain-containing protein [Gilliamella sp. B3815]MCX8579068.1 glycine zipper 2TM domain-containing protein [Gilliamella sp. B2717]MCX8588196.1 glycine zipper 2TM domain-containing protein [Gilliamella sp. B3801]MCX8589486.1 glycine zipper 2TM domain-containing protein [Gilliamella sp. B3812]
MKKIVLTSIIVAILSGCSNSDIYSGDVYTTDQAKQVQQVSYGTVVSVRPVKIQTNASNGRSENVVGSLGGAVIGGVLGNTIGDGAGRALAVATGAIGGALIGNTIEDKASQSNAVELEIKQANGANIVIVQKGTTKEFYVGQQVRLVSNGRQISASPRYTTSTQ